MRKRTILALSQQHFMDSEIWFHLSLHVPKYYSSFDFFLPNHLTNVKTIVTLWGPMKTGIGSDGAYPLQFADPVSGARVLWQESVISVCWYFLPQCPNCCLIHRVNFWFPKYVFSILELSSGCFLSFHSSAELPICSLIVFVWVCSYWPFSLCYRSCCSARLVIFFIVCWILLIILCLKSLALYFGRLSVD